MIGTALPEYERMPIVKMILVTRKYRFYQKLKAKWNAHTCARRSLVCQFHFQVTKFPIFSFSHRIALIFWSKAVHAFPTHIVLCTQNTKLECAHSPKWWWLTDFSLVQQHNTNRQKQSIYSIYCTISLIQWSFLLFFMGRTVYILVCANVRKRM